MLLCLCVTMQALGAPITLWEPHGNDDLLGASILEGFSIPADLLTVVVSAPEWVAFDHLSFVRSAVVLHDVFHPPYSVFL